MKKTITAETSLSKCLKDTAKFIGKLMFMMLVVLIGGFLFLIHTSCEKEEILLEPDSSKYHYYDSVLLELINSENDTVLIYDTTHQTSVDTIIITTKDTITIFRDEIKRVLAIKANYQGKLYINYGRINEPLMHFVDTGIVLETIYVDRLETVYYTISDRDFAQPYLKLTITTGDRYYHHSDIEFIGHSFPEHIYLGLKINKYFEMQNDTIYIDLNLESQSGTEYYYCPLEHYVAVRN